jgi:hypothetical protein
VRRIVPKFGSLMYIPSPLVRGALRGSLNITAGSRLASALVVAASWLVAVPLACGLQPSDQRFDFEVREGLNTNHFVRVGEVAAHLVLRDGTDPRILIAFPAGNSGVGVWFVPERAKASWVLSGPPRALNRVDEHGRALYGISADATVETQDLEIRQAVLSSIRVLRDFQQLGKLPEGITTAPVLEGRTLRWSRDRLDGAAGYRLELEVTHGELSGKHIHAAADGRIGLRVTGLTGETPLTGLAGRELLADPAVADPDARNALTFLAYREKLLAGSWRFDTYFGRDTLMSVRLLMPALSPTAVEAGLSAVLARLSPLGEVAHEEDIGERAVLDHLQSEGKRSAASVYDYKMIDGNYLLAPVLAAWLLADGRLRPGAAAFLSAPAAGPEGRAGTRGAALMENLKFVLRSAAPFAAAPAVDHLISLKSGFAVGEWRDSETGLGGGRYPYDVNATLVPAALQASAQLNDSGVLSPYMSAQDRALIGRAAQMAQTWRERAPRLFQITLGRKAAVDAIEKYAAQQSVPAQSAVASVGDAGVHFHAIALDAAAKPIPVLHSDEGFALLFGELSAASVDQAITATMRPFPAGLMTAVGMVVANPVYGPPALQAQFTRNAYHGTVVWSWQQALFAAGLERQLQRTDLPAAVRAHLLEAQRTLWSAITSTRSMNNSELWSWSIDDGHYRVAPFGAAAADADESNAAQLWSTVYLAMKPPQVH